MQYRIATPNDATALAAIYAPYVENTAISFEYTAPSPEEFADRITHTLTRYPYFVAEQDGIIIGYAYASAFKERAAYDWSVETSIYVSAAYHSKGTGRLLYQVLEDTLKKQHVCTMCACIAYPNPPSISFHESMGFHHVAHFTASGYKMGTWYDMIWMEKEIAPHTVPPIPFVPFPQLTDNQQTTSDSF